MIRNHKINIVKANISRPSFLLFKIINYLISILSRLSFNVLNFPIIFNLPTKISIEPVEGICPLRCPLCLGNDLYSRNKSKFMPINEYKKIIDKIKHHTIFLRLIGLGETLLHPNFYDIFKYASNQGIYVQVDSTLSFDIDAEKLVKSGLNALVVSLDGVSQDVYEKYRVNGKVEKVIKNIKYIKNACKKYDKKIQLSLKFLVFKHNEHEINDAKQLAKKLGLSISFHTPSPFGTNDLEIFTKDYQSNLPEYQFISNKNGTYELNYSKNKNCYFLFDTIAIDCEGFVLHCRSSNRRYLKWNIHNQTLSRIWFSSDFHNFRKRYLTKYSKMKECKFCVCDKQRTNLN